MSRSGEEVPILYHLPPFTLINTYVYMCVYVCMYIYIYIYIYMCVCVCVCVCATFFTYILRTNFTIFLFTIHSLLVALSTL